MIPSMPCAFFTSDIFEKSGSGSWVVGRVAGSRGSFSQFEVMMS